MELVTTIAQKTGLTKKDSEAALNAFTTSVQTAMKKKERVVPATDATNKGISDAVVKSTIKTSIAKTIAAIGALKIAAMAPVAPQANNKICERVSSLNILPMLEPIAEPVYTIGASNPTEPPKPTVNVLATKELQVLCRAIFPLF